MNSMTLEEALLKYRPHRGLSGASLIDKLVYARPGTDSWRLDLTREEQEMLGRILAEDDQVPPLAEVERALAALTAKRLRGHERTITDEIARAETSGESETVSALLVLKKLARRGERGWRNDVQPTIGSTTPERDGRRASAARRDSQE